MQNDRRSMSNLNQIAVIDVLDLGLVRHAVESRGCARALRDGCVSWLPAAAACQVRPEAKAVLAQREYATRDAAHG